MTDVAMYLWDQERAVQYLSTRHAICQACGERVSYFPLEAMLRHTLNHAYGDELKRIETLIAMVTDKKEMNDLARYLLQGLGDPNLIRDCIERGILVRVRHEEP